VRDAALVLIGGAVLREVYQPARDTLRAGGNDDGCGGVLDGAAGRVRLGLRGLILAR
jgi:hypothetical protein